MSGCADSGRVRRIQNASGFTYLWTLFAIAFAGIGMMIGAELWATTVKRDREAELIHVGRQFREAIGRYYESTPGGAKQYPPSLDELLKDSRFPAPRRHLRKIYSDPVTGKTDWELVRIGGRVVGIRSRSTETPLKSAGFDLTEASFQGKEKYADWSFTYPHDLLLRTEGKPGNSLPSQVSGQEPPSQFPTHVVQEVKSSAFQ